MKILEANNIEKSYPVGHIIQKKFQALKGVSFTVDKGEIFGLLGHNGAGKTTFFKILTGLAFPDNGTIKLFGQDISQRNIKEKIGFLPEHPYFYPYLNPKEILSFYGGLFSIDKKIIEERTDYLINLLGLNKWKNEPIKKFSKGMIQRVGMAQALINDPDLLILDEPMSGLDPIGRKEFKEIIIKQKQKGKTIIFSSHILSDVEMICDKIAMLIKGEIVKEGNIQNLLSEGNSEYEIELEKEKSINIIKNLGFKYEILNKNIIIKIDNYNEAKKVLLELINTDVKIISFTPVKSNLEELLVKEINKSEKS